MDEGQLDYLKALFEKVQTIEEEGIGKVPLEWMTGDQVRRIEPDVAPECVGGLYSSETGIIDSHALMEDLEKGIEESDGGEVVYGTKVVRIDRLENLGGRKGDGSEEGWVVQTVTGGSAMEEGERNAVLCRAVINSAGLKYVSPLINPSPTDAYCSSAHHLHNQILPPSSRVPLYFAKGSYFTYRGPGLTNVSHLLYPCPDHTGGSLAGLGTHLTFNLAGEICFGPDVEWIQAPFCEVQGGVEDVSDFWERELVPRRERLEGVYEAVRRYLPGVEKDGFETDCSSFPFSFSVSTTDKLQNDRRRYSTKAQRARSSSSRFLNQSSATWIYLVARYRITWTHFVARDRGEGGGDCEERGVGIGKGWRRQNERDWTE